MAIRKSSDETFSVSGDVANWLIKVNQALDKGGFSNVNSNNTLNQVTADYKKLTVWGKIIVTLHPESGFLKVHAKSTANVDNIFSLFVSPNQKILDAFKNKLS